MLRVNPGVSWMERRQQLVLGLLVINGMVSWMGTMVLIHPDPNQALAHWFASETYESATRVNQADRY